jgi:CBS domain-containing protein
VQIGKAIPKLCFQDLLRRVADRSSALVWQEVAFKSGLRNMRRKCAILSNDDGSVVVEFAVVLALILLSAAAAMMLLGSESERTFALLGHRNWTEDSLSSSQNSDGAVNAPSTAESRDSKLESSEPALVTINQQTLTAMIAAFALLCYLVSRQRRVGRRRALEQLDQDRQRVERIHNKRFLKRQYILKVLSADPDALLENRIEVRHLMTTELRTVRPKTTLDCMKAMMDDEFVSHFPVVTEKGRIVGIVSDRELVGVQARTAADVMTRSMVTVGPGTRIATALSQMINRNLSCLPVIDGDNLVGILTGTDAVMTLQCALQLRHRSGRIDTARQPLVV